MTATPRIHVHDWAPAHRALLALIATLIVVAAVAVTVVLVLGAGTRPAADTSPAGGPPDAVCAHAPVNAAC